MRDKWETDVTQVTLSRYLSLEQVAACMVITHNAPTEVTVAFGYEDDDATEIGDDPFVETEGDDEEDED